MRRVHKTSESKITRPARVAILLGATALVAAGSAHAATFTWNGGGANDNMTTGANWVGGVAPTLVDNHDLQFAGNTRLSPTIQSGVWDVNSITFNSGAGAFSLVQAAGSAPRYNLGAGGVTVNATNAQTLRSNIYLTANQTWAATSGGLNIGSVSNERTLDLQTRTLTLSAPASRTVTQVHSVTSTGGTGTINLNGAATSTIFGISGSADSNVNFVLNGGEARLNASSGLGGATTWNTPASTLINLNSTGTGVTWTGSSAVPTNLTFGSSTGTYGFTQGNNTSTIEWAGNWSGVFAAGTDNRIGVRLQFSDTSVLRLSGNNSGLTTTKTAANDAVMWLRRGRLILDSANAFGTGNSLTIGIGDGNNTGQSRLLATSGNHVSGNVLVNYRPAGTQENTGNLFVGLEGTGAVTFSGDLRLNPNNDTTTSTRDAFLVGGSGTATFSGTILDANTSGRNIPIRVSTGTVILTGNNTYKGGTTVQQTGGGTTLLVNNTTGSGTGTGPVQVNADNALGGIGFIAGAVNVDGILRPGTPAVSGGVGTLTFLDNLTVIGRYDAQVNASTSDLLALTGVTNNTLTLGAASSLDVLGTLNPAVDYTLATYGARTGTFNSVLLNGVAQPTPTAFGGVGGTHTLVYNTSALQLVAIPEPSALGLLGFAGLAMLRRRRVGNA